MSNTLINRDLGLRDYALIRTERKKSEIYYHLCDPKPACPTCRSENVAHDGVTTRTIRIAGFENKRCYAVVQVPRICCRNCDFRGRGTIRFADPNKSYSRSFERSVLSLIKLSSSFEDIAKHVGYAWPVIKAIHKRDLKRQFGKTPLKHLKRIAIGEIYLGRKLKYRTLVLDLDSGAIVYVGQGRDQEALDSFWRSLRGSGAKVKAVAMDMSRAYAAAVTKNLPKAKIVFDPFHVIKLMNEHLDELRRRLVREAEKKQKGEDRQRPEREAEKRRPANEGGRKSSGSLSRASAGCCSKAGRASTPNGRAGTGRASGNGWTRRCR